MNLGLHVSMCFVTCYPGVITNMAELEALRDQLKQSEMLMQEMSMTWEEKLKVCVALNSILCMCFSVDLYGRYFCMHVCVCVCDAHPTM